MQQNQPPPPPQQPPPQQQQPAQAQPQPPGQPQPHYQPMPNQALVPQPPPPQQQPMYPTHPGQHPHWAPQHHAPVPGPHPHWQPQHHPQQPAQAQTQPPGQPQPHYQPMPNQPLVPQPPPPQQQPMYPTHPGPHPHWAPQHHQPVPGPHPHWQPQHHPPPPPPQGQSPQYQSPPVTMYPTHPGPHPHWAPQHHQPVPGPHPHWQPQHHPQQPPPQGQSPQYQSPPVSMYPTHPGQHPHWAPQHHQPVPGPHPHWQPQHHQQQSTQAQPQQPGRPQPPHYQPMPNQPLVPQPPPSQQQPMYPTHPGQHPHWAPQHHPPVPGPHPHWQPQHHPPPPPPQGQSPQYQSPPVPAGPPQQANWGPNHAPPSRVQTPQHVSLTPRPQPQISTPASPISSLAKIEKKENVFPKNSVEATKLINSKKKKLTSKDVSDIEMWRLIMCMKSGLLAESSWAIDVLGILLSDDSTSSYFALSNCPGLLEVVIEHFKCCLNEIYDGIVEDTILKSKICESNVNPCDVNEVETPVKVEPVIGKRKVNGVSERNQSKAKTQKLADQIVMLKTAKNYTFKTREGKVVKFKDSVKQSENKVWDLTYGPIESGYSHWREGNGEDISHIKVYFEPKIKFSKLSKRNHKAPKSIEVNNNVSSNGPRDEITIKKESSETNDSNITELNDDTDTETEDETKQEQVNGVSNGVNIDKVKIKINGNQIASESPQPDANTTHESLASTASSFPRVRPAEEESYKFKYQEPEVEDETCSLKGDQLLNHAEDYQMSLSRRCGCLSSILRNLSFIPGNDCEMSKHAGLLLILGRLLLLKHKHVQKQNSTSVEKNNGETSNMNFCASIDESDWYWGLLNNLREDILVTISNISSSLDLSPFNEKINYSLLEGLLHWAVCSSSYALEPFPTSTLAVSPQRLALESLAKLSIIEGNVDLILATPPWSRIEELFMVLSRFLGINEDQTTREFSLVLISNLVSAGSSIARVVALKGSVIQQLISFLESAEAKSLEVAAAQGHKASKEPEASGTTQDMLKRAAHTLQCISVLSDNHQLFLQHQDRLLSLVMSPVMDSGVVSLLADVIFEISSSSC